MRNLTLVQALNKVRVMFKVTPKQAHIVSLIANKTYIDDAIAISIDSNGFIDSWNTEESYKVGTLKYSDYEEITLY